MNDKIKYLEMIQGVINRMANNSFALKGWAVTLVAGTFVLAGKSTDSVYFLVAYVPIFIFWGLDSYYLLQERLYRALYDKARNTPNESVDFSLKASKEEFADKSNKWWNCVWSTTEKWFYIPLAILATMVVVIAIISNGK